MSLVAIIFIRSGLSLVIFGVIFAVLSYLRTSRFKQQTGVDPWHIPPPVWALASFFIALLGTLLSIIACATTKVPGRGTGQMFSAGPGPGTAPGYTAPGYGPPGGYTPPPGYGPGGGYGPPGGPMPASGSHPSVYPAFPAAPAPPTAAGPPAWHPDPTGRHHHRYWDGSQWTEHVSDSGTAATDPIGTPSQGPV